MEKAEIIKQIEQMKKKLELKQVSNCCEDSVELRDAIEKVIISRLKQYYEQGKDELNVYVLYLKNK